MGAMSNSLALYHIQNAPTCIITYDSPWPWERAGETTCGGSVVLLETMEHSIPVSGQCYSHKADTQRRSKQVHPFSNRGAAGRSMAFRAAGLPGKVCQLLLPLRGRGGVGHSGNLNLIPPASHVHRFQSGDMVNRRSNHWLNKIPTLSDLGQSVHFWAGKVLGLRKSLKNVTSITGQLAQEIS